MSLPVYVSGNFVGVVGIDMSIADLFEEVDYFVQDAQTYAFVVNHNGYLRFMFSSVYSIPQIYMRNLVTPIKSVGQVV